jgi:hypothetical protein
MPLDVQSPFIPVGVEPRYAAPRAAIGPATQANWLKRALPVVAAHRWVFGTSLALSFAGLVVQVLLDLAFWATRARFLFELF